MASFQAISGVATAVTTLLDQSWPAGLMGLQPSFEVYHGKNFDNPMATGISVFVYQVTVDPVQRTLPPAERLHRRPVPLRASLLVTAWGEDVSAEHALLGWAIRAIADEPVLSAGFLNAAIPGVFRPEETIELSPLELTNDEVFQLWQAMPGDLQLSVAYLARVVRIESTVIVPEAPPVTERYVDVAVL